MNTTLISRIRTAVGVLSICHVWLLCPQTQDPVYGATPLTGVVRETSGEMTSGGESSGGVVAISGIGTPEGEDEDLVTEVRIEGNRRFANSEVSRQIQTRVGRAYDPKIVESDVRRLVSSKRFLDVQPTTQRTEKGRIVTFTVREREVLTDVKIIGSHDIRRNRILKKIGIRRGDPADPYTVRQGKLLIEELYREEGYGNVHVEIFEGDQPGDYRAIYVIHEGQKQRIFRVNFEGNQFASDGQLKAKIQSKPGILWLIGGDVKRETIEADVHELEGYYHSFGFFQAEIERDLDWDENEKWLTLTFHISEGVRSRIRSIEFAGNRRFDE
ncbi:MAG: POTRA domain-containing protein, partial [Planctomycetia bacterium]|nr:POTRA domain-containing protein [Planctomycetia bacterium]